MFVVVVVVVIVVVVFVVVSLWVKVVCSKSSTFVLVDSEELPYS